MRDEFLEPILASDREVADEVGLRPRLLDDFVGQRELKEHLDIVLGAAKQRGQAADHILLAGPPGLGKTGGRPGPAAPRAGGSGIGDARAGCPAWSGQRR